MATRRVGIGRIMAVSILCTGSLLQEQGRPMRLLTRLGCLVMTVAPCHGETKAGRRGRMARHRWRGGSLSRLARLQAMAAHLLRRGEEGEAEMGGSVCGGWEG